MALPVTGSRSSLKNGYESVDPVGSFGTVKISADEVILSNRSSPLDQEERVVFRTREIEKVQMASKLQVRNPAAVKSGVSYSIVYETVNRTVLPSGVIIDEPISMSLVVRHPRSGNITEAVLNQCFARLMGCALIPANSLTDAVIDIDGNSELRFLDLARFAEQPVRATCGKTADS